MPEPPARPSLLDRVHQRLYRLGYLAFRRWWGIAHPRTRGAFVGIWCEGRVLVLQNSYVGYRSFPGGGVGREEPPAEAAARECGEEVGLAISPDVLRLDFVVEQRWEGKQDTVWMYVLELADEPEIRIDHREVVDARFMSPEDALAAPLFEPARRHIEGRAREWAG
jgi:8-oxo-dGTP pyrophosphatase MutT (NUDIX family)